MSPNKTNVRNPERTRSRLLKTAIRLFSAKGVNGVSVDELVAAAKVNKRMVYHYFGSKDGLYQAALHSVYSRIESIELDAVEGEVSPKHKLEHLLKNYFRFLEKNADFTRFLQWENLDKGRRIAKKDHPLNKNAFLETFRKVVEDGITMGEFRKDLDVVHLLIHLIGLCFIYHSNRYSLSQSLGVNLSNEAIRQEGLNGVIQLVMEGIANRS